MKSTKKVGQTLQLLGLTVFTLYKLDRFFTLLRYWQTRRLSFLFSHIQTERLFGLLLPFSFRFYDDYDDNDFEIQAQSWVQYTFYFIDNFQHHSKKSFSFLFHLDIVILKQYLYTLIKYTMIICTLFTQIAFS